jgi:hypothetical protein
MPFVTRFTRLAAAVLAVCVVAFGFLPAMASAAAPAVSHRATQAEVNLAGDTATSSSARSTRRSGSAWSGRKILYTESIPSKWDWSLNTAIAKWNATGGGIKFVRTTNVRKARLNIAYGSIGSQAGLASVGKSRHAWVRLSSSYSSANALDARVRVQVMGIFAHELGHVLGFQHTSTKCVLMSPVLDVDGCNMVPASTPGYYKCRTIDPVLATRFVKLYGGHARFPSALCPIDPLPSAANRVAITGGESAPLTVSWSKPAYAPSGSQMKVRTWGAASCGAAPANADVAYAAVATGKWQDTVGEPSGTSCVSVQLVNRYGAGRAAVSRLLRF